MADPRQHRSETWPKLDSHGAAPRPTAHGLLWRIYALVPIFIVLFLSYQAIKYLFVSLLFPYAAPEQITSIPTRLTDEMWRTEPAAWIGRVLAREAPRTPLAHYHRIDGWFQPDSFNDCTRSGCHFPMPHNKRKEIRAFLNMHTTSMHCGVCHLKSDDKPLPMTWYGLRDGRAGEVPALLEVYGWLNSPEGHAALANPTSAAQDKLVKLLRATAREASGDPTLKGLAEEVAAVRYSSSAFQMAVAVARTQIPLHFHGEYGAKLALYDTRTGQPILGHPGSAAAVTEFLKNRDNLDDVEREKLLEQVHTARRAETLDCHNCHRKDEALADLQSIGYPPPRIRALREGWIFRAIEDIAAGQILHLPEFVSPYGERQPTSTPAAENP